MESEGDYGNALIAFSNDELYLRVRERGGSLGPADGGWAVGVAGARQGVAAKAVERRLVAEG